MIALADDEVHVYWIPLIAPDGAERSLTLPEAEAARAARFVFAEHRRQWVLCRIALRRILERYVNVTAGEVAFDYGSHGKPSLASGSPCFNVSHSGGAALLAVSAHREVGADIELPREFADLDSLAGNVFSDAERRQWNALAGEERTAAFFRVWTRKEAYIKARGLGLAIPLRDFDVSLAADPGPLLCAVRAGECNVGPWQIWNLDAPPPYAAALALAGGGRPRIERFEWDWASA